MSKNQQTYECQFCQKVYKRKSFFEKHVSKCKEIELEEFNYESLIEDWKLIDPEIAHCFEIEYKNVRKDALKFRK